MCGLDHTLLLLETGTVWACGWAADGQTGIHTHHTMLAIHNVVENAGVGSYENTGQLKPVDLGGRKVRSLSSFADSSFALTSEEFFGTKIQSTIILIELSSRALSIVHIIISTILLQKVTKCLRGVTMSIDSWVWPQRNLK